MEALSEETLDAPDISEKKPKRVFLIVLSVLTFISGVLRLIFTITFFTDKKISNERLSTDSLLRWLVLFALAFGISALFNIVGVILMLARKKGGYVSYLIGEAFFLLNMIGVTLSIRSGPGNLSYDDYLFFIFLHLLPFVFAILYKAALKQSKNGGTV